MRTASRSQLLRQLSLWLLGQALPQTDVLRQPMRYALLGMMAASVAGTLLALSIAAGMGVLYFILVQQGLATAASLAVVAGFGVLLALLAYSAARRRMDAIPDTLSELHLFGGQRTGDVVGDFVAQLLNGFFDGAAQEAKASTQAAARSREEIEEAMEALIDELDAMEAEANRFADEAEEVVLDIERHAPAKPRRRKTQH